MAAHPTTAPHDGASQDVPRDMGEADLGCPSAVEHSDPPVEYHASGDVLRSPVHDLYRFLTAYPCTCLSPPEDPPHRATIVLDVARDPTWSRWR